MGWKVTAWSGELGENLTLYISSKSVAEVSDINWFRTKKKEKEKERKTER